MKPRIGIRPVIDGRCYGVRESLEEQTMAMAKAAKKLIESNVFYGDGTPAEVVISPLCAHFVIAFDACNAFINGNACIFAQLLEGVSRYHNFGIHPGGSFAN